MLQSIFIQNYALIDKLDISFTSGFSVITGETGAGKSIILGAIGLLLGQRADVKAIKKGASKCIVEATFRITGYGMEDFFQENDIEYEPDECILRREVSANGKSRAFINDTPASLAQMKVLGEKLIGAILVGTGLPQLGNEREILRSFYTENGENGFD